MDNGAPIQQFPNQEDKSGKPTYAAATARNSSTIDPRSPQAEIGLPSRAPIRELFHRLRRILKRG